MFFALDQSHNRIDISNAEKGGTFYCPICGGSVIIRDGQINAKHFAHRSGSCTDNWHYDMSEWHRRMQSHFNEQYREVVVTNGSSVHRADILVEKTVIEFQHSPISTDEFNDRNLFFTRLGYRIAWVFDVSEQYQGGQIRDCDSDQYSGLKYEWLHPNRVITSFDRISDYSKTFSVWLYLPSDDEPEAICKVIWTAQTDNGPSMRHFVVSNHWLELEDGYEQEIDCFFYSNTDYFRQAKKYLLQGHSYQIKYKGEKGKPYDSYICPLWPDDFGIKIGTEIGCAYCPHCALIAGEERNKIVKWAVYCCYPEKVREEFEGHPGYCCDQAPIYFI